MLAQWAFAKTLGTDVPSPMELMMNHLGYSKYGEAFILINLNVMSLYRIAIINELHCYHYPGVHTGN